MKLITKTFLLGIAVMLVQTGGVWAQTKPVAGKEITFGLISTSTTDDYSKRWRPLLDDLATQLGQKVVALPSKNIVEDIRAGKVQVAWLSNKLALDAVATGKMNIFAQMVKDDGTAGYSSLLIVRNESPLMTAEDVFKKPGVLKFGYGEASSTSGYLVPEAFLFKKANIDTGKHFKSVLRQGHRANFLALANKEVDLATSNTEDLELFKKEYPDKYKDIRVIWKSQTMPDHPILIARDMPDATRAKIEEFFLKYGSDKKNVVQAETLKNIRGLSGFRRSTNFQLKTIAVLEMHSEVSKLESTPGLSAEEKKQRQEEIATRMKKLDAMLGGGQGS